jgi:hypothetical protein
LQLPQTKGVFSFPSIPKIFLGFDSSFYKIELNTMQKFWQKDGYSPF